MSTQRDLQHYRETDPLSYPLSMLSSMPLRMGASVLRPDASRIAMASAGANGTARSNGVVGRYCCALEQNFVSGHPFWTQSTTY